MLTLYFCSKLTGEILYTFHPDNTTLNIGNGWIKFRENGSPVEIRMDFMNYFYSIVNE